MDWLIRILMFLIVMSVITLLRKKIWGKYGEGIKDFLRIMTKTKLQKAMLTVICVSILALSSIAVWVYASPPEQEERPPTWEEKYVMWFTENVVVNTKEEIPPPPLNLLVEKIEAEEVAEVHRKYRSKESTTIIEYYTKFKEEDDYRLFNVPWDFKMSVNMGLFATQMSIDTVLTQFVNVPDFIIPAEPEIPEMERGVLGQWWFYVGLILLLVTGFVFVAWFMIRKQLRAGKEFRKMVIDRYAGEKITFDDIAGMVEVKQEILEVKDFVKKPEEFKAKGARIPKGVLMVGPPGNGKTMLAKAVATEAGCPFLSISGSEFVEIFVGVGAGKVRDLFDMAKKLAPCIVFIDEIDAVGKKREAGLGSGANDEREQTLNQILTEMDGFASGSGIIVLAATNRRDLLDPALVRPGRFDREVYIGEPHVKDREAILRVHTRNKPMADDIDFRELAQSIPLGSSGADLENIVNEAAIRAVKLQKEKIDKECLRYAKDKITFGLERKGMIVTDKEKEISAFHEAGHALIAVFTPDASPLNRVSIVPRAKSLGFVYTLPDEDRYLKTREELLALIDICMGGKAAEETFFNTSSSGVRSDLELATKTAKDMVCVYGMDDDIGPISLPVLAEGMIQLTDEVIQNRVGCINTEALARAKKLIEEKKPRLQALAKTLLAIENIDEGKLAIKILKDEKLAEKILAADKKDLDKIIDAIKV